MSYEWKKGDRFTLEFEIIEPYNADSVCPARSQVCGHTGWSTWFSEAMLKHDTLIKPAEEAPKLDTERSMRPTEPSLYHHIVTFIGYDKDGALITETEKGMLERWHADMLENIPESKRTTTQIVELVDFEFGRRIMMKSDGAFYVNVASRAKVSYSDGEGWSVEEVL